MSGFIAISRDIWDDTDFPDEPMSKREAFMWMVAEAAWKPRTVRRKSVSLSLQRGQLAHSVRFLAEAFGWHRAKVERFLTMLKNRDTIETRTETGLTVITICNYDRYQSAEAPSETAIISERDSSETNQNKDNNTTLLGARDLNELSDLCLEAAGDAMADPARSTGVMVMSTPLSWIKSGADLQLDILPTLKAKAANRPKGSVMAWAYFTAAVMEAKARREQGHDTPEIDDEQKPSGAGRAASDRGRSASQQRKSAWVGALEELGCGHGSQGGPERPGGDGSGEGGYLRIAHSG